MTDDTALDIAHAAMTAAPDDDHARLGFYERLADAQLFLLLAEEPQIGDTLSPQVFDLEEGSFVLVFDREDRLAEFAGGPSEFAALSGRQAVRLLDGRGVGLGVNLGVAPSAILIPAEALTWLAETLDTAPQPVSDRPAELTPPADLPQALLAGLDRKLARAGGLADCAWLVGARYSDGQSNHLLALIDPAPGAEAALAQAVGEALVFSGLDAAALDVAFFGAADPIAEMLARVGLRFDLPQAEVAERAAPAAPGSDPNRPPILR